MKNTEIQSCRLCENSGRLWESLENSGRLWKSLKNCGMARNNPQISKTNDIVENIFKFSEDSVHSKNISED